MNEDSIDLGESTAKLTSAVENLPQILEKKRKIDSHTNIATSLLDEIKNRNLDEYYRIKDKIVKQGKLEKNIKDYLKDAEFGNDNDKLRLLLTYLLGMLQSIATKLTFILAYQNVTENVEELVEILEQTEIDTNSIRYVRKMKGISTTNKENNPSSGWGGRLGGLANAVSQVRYTCIGLGSNFAIILDNWWEEIILCNHTSFRFNPNWR